MAQPLVRSDRRVFNNRSEPGTPDRERIRDCAVPFPLPFGRAHWLRPRDDDGYPMNSTRRSILQRLVLAAGVLFASTGPICAAEALEHLRDRLRLAIDHERVSVSGLSSGGWMANQFHIAFSSAIMGAGVLAAGPYHCAGGTSWLCHWTPYGWLTPHDTCQAVHVCTRSARKTYGPLAPYLGPPDAATSVDSTLRASANGTIDALENLRGDRVWLFSGQRDSLAPREVMEELRIYYRMLFDRPEVGNPRTAIAFVDDLAVEHAMVVDIAGPEAENRCGAYASPYINDCDYPAAGRLLTFLYELPADGPAPRYGDWDRSALNAFDQTAFFDSSDTGVSLNGTGNLYVPAACRGEVRCPLHVAFHGCEQYAEAIDAAHGDVAATERPYFHTHSGYNEYADRYGIVVLYPQTTAWGLAGDAARNPKGCWDWWGYSGDDYFLRSGKQMRAVRAMIACLARAAACHTPEDP